MHRESERQVPVYDFGNSVCCQKVRITLVDINLMPFGARLDYLGLLWTDNRPRVRDWWARAQE